MVGRSRGAFLLVVLAACHGAGDGGQAPPPRPATRAEAPLDAGLSGNAPRPPGLRAQLPSVRPVGDDTRLAKVRERLLARDDRGAAAAMAEARAAQPLGSYDRCVWSYYEGRLAIAADAMTRAAVLFDEVAKGPAPLATAMPEAEDATAPSAASCPLAPYAMLRAAQVYVKLGDGEQALARARALSDEVLLADEGRLALADALALHGDRAEAMAAWRAALAASPRGFRWVESSIRLANALLETTPGRTDEERKAAAEEALALATRALVEGPRAGDSFGADIVRVRALGLLGRTQKGIPALSVADAVRRAQVQFESSDGERAMLTLGPVLAKRGLKKDEPELACRAFTLKAQVLGRGRGAAEAWGDAIDACAKSDALPTALYHGGRAAYREKRVRDAEARWTRLETAFPKHRLADDARFFRATTAQDEGDDARFLERMRSVADDFPQGDMGAEALFRVALAAMVKGDWVTARPALERIEGLARDAGAMHSETAGLAQTSSAGDTVGPPDPAGPSTDDAGAPVEGPRAPVADPPVLDGAARTRFVALERAAPRALYFLGRAAAAMGEAEAARRYFLRVIATYPLTFYMAEAYARLDALDPGQARRALDEGAGREEGSEPFLARPYVELASAHFDRARRLLEVGELDAGRKELAAAGITAEGAPSELVWLAGHLYDQAGFPEVGHAIGRYRLTEHWAHYPTGRWRVAWEVTFPRAFEGLVTTEGAKNAVPLPLAWGIMREESGFVAEARSPANAFGLMQLIPPTARIVARGTGLPSDETALRRPAVNVALGTRLLAQLRSALTLHPALPIAAYNAGAGAVGRWLQARGALDADLWIESIPYEETRNYVKKVLTSELAYAFLQNRDGLEDLLHMPRGVMRAGATPSLQGVP